jgi:hypothetical protein
MMIANGSPRELIVGLGKLIDLFGRPPASFTLSQQRFGLSKKVCLLMGDP